jgi:hypothetical protein
MVTLRCTRKLLRRVGVAPKTNTAPPTTVLGDWYANIVYSRPQQLVVCMNERSLLLVLLAARDVKNIGPRLRASVTALLARIGAPVASCDTESQAMQDFAFGPTANRSVLGCLNEAMFALSLELRILVSLQSRSWKTIFQSISTVPPNTSHLENSPLSYSRQVERVSTQEACTSMHSNFSSSGRVASYACRRRSTCR